MSDVFLKILSISFPANVTVAKARILRAATLELGQCSDDIMAALNGGRFAHMWVYMHVWVYVFSECFFHTSIYRRICHHKVYGEGDV